MQGVSYCDAGRETYRHGGNDNLMVNRNTAVEFYSDALCTRLFDHAIVEAQRNPIAQQQRVVRITISISCMEGIRSSENITHVSVQSRGVGAKQQVLIR